MSLRDVVTFIGAVCAALSSIAWLLLAVRGARAQLVSTPQPAPADGPYRTSAAPESLQEYRARLEHQDVARLALERDRYKQALETIALGMDSSEKVAKHALGK
jgi:hypothetical protein